MPKSPAQSPALSANQEGLSQSIHEFVDQVSTIFGMDLTYIALFDEGGEAAFHKNQRLCDIDQEDQKKLQSIAERARTARSMISGRLQGGVGRGEQQQRASDPQYFWIGAPIFDANDAVCGALVAASGSARRRSKLKEAHLSFLTSQASMILEHHRSLMRPNHRSESQFKTKETPENSETKLLGLSPEIPAAAFSYTRKADGADEIRSMSPGCINIWGHTSDELQNDPGLIWAAVVPEDLEALQASIQQSRYDMTHWQHRWRIRDKSGFLKWLQAYSTPCQTPDGNVTWSTLILDVTVEQQAQITLAENTRLLHEAQRLESIGRLAGGVAHDFNNLLSVIMGNAEAIRPAKLSPDAAESVDEIIEASQRGAVLVKQLLSFARKSDLRETSANIQSVLAEVDRLLRRVLPSNISLQIIQSAGLWSVQIDQAMFENALLNLVINARDAMPDGGALTIETSNVSVDRDYLESREEDVKAGRYVMVAITDTGQGIEESVLPYVFEPFFTTKGPKQGTGLGLAMVQGFVKQSEGMVRIYSELGHGTSIKMYFPAEERSQALKKIEDFGVPRFKATQEKVLLVEDQAAVRRIIEKLLTSAGYSVVTAQSGDEAIAIYRKIHDEIDLIVTDVVMPGKLQGPQFVRLARKINDSVPVLYMSGYPHEANVHGNGIRSGDISLMKPIRRSDLLTALIRLKRRV